MFFRNTLSLLSASMALSIFASAQFTIALKKDPSICIAASSATADAPVVVEPCAAGSASQTWSDPNNDGHLAVFGDLCITPAAPVINDGVNLVLAACDPGNANQKFSHTTGVLNSHNVAKSVIDLTDGNETPGTQLQMWTGGIFTISGDNDNQDWIVTTV
ncbi:hypothetical protein C8R44DRAFT_728421 [Mycena epipterygia]|nr:hypothetical protein C8R44DRAFT_728421 [Mycena epipterygia]